MVVVEMPLLVVVVMVGGWMDGRGEGEGEGAAILKVQVGKAK